MYNIPGDGRYLPHRGMPEEVYRKLVYYKPDERPEGWPDWTCRCSKENCWTCVHSFYNGYDEAQEIAAADEAGAPVHAECGAHSNRHMCGCGDWFCDRCGDHIPNADGSFNNKNPCWAGCA